MLPTRFGGVRANTVPTLCPLRRYLRCLQESSRVHLYKHREVFVRQTDPNMNVGTLREQRPLCQILRHWQSLSQLESTTMSTSYSTYLSLNALYNALIEQETWSIRFNWFLFCWPKYILIVSININGLNFVNRSTVFYRSWESTKRIYVFPSVTAANLHINWFIFVKECDVFIGGLKTYV